MYATIWNNQPVGYTIEWSHAYSTNSPLNCSNRDSLADPKGGRIRGSPVYQCLQYLLCHMRMHGAKVVMMQGARLSDGGDGAGS